MSKKKDYKAADDDLKAMNAALLDTPGRRKKVTPATPGAEKPEEPEGTDASVSSEVANVVNEESSEETKPESKGSSSDVDESSKGTESESKDQSEDTEQPPREIRIGRKPDYPTRSQRKGTVKRIAVLIEVETFSAIKRALGGSHIEHSQNTLVNAAIKAYLGDQAIEEAKEALKEKGIL